MRNLHILLTFEGLHFPEQINVSLANRTALGPLLIIENKNMSKYMMRRVNKRTRTLHKRVREIFQCACTRIAAEYTQNTCFLLTLRMRALRSMDPPDISFSINTVISSHQITTSSNTDVCTEEKAFQTLDKVANRGHKFKIKVNTGTGRQSFVPNRNKK